MDRFSQEFTLGKFFTNGKFKENLRQNANFDLFHQGKYGISDDHDCPVFVRKT